MGISSTLLVMAVAAGLAPALVWRFRPPAGLLGVIGGVLGSGLAVAIGWSITERWHPFRLFEIIHLAYLLVVVTIPVALGSWFIIAVLRRGQTRTSIAAGALALTVGSLGVWGTHVEPNLLRVDRVTVASEAIDAPLTIGVLADLQTPDVGGIEQAAIDALLVESPDLVLVPGDLFQGPNEIIDANSSDFSELLRQLVDEVELVAVVSGDSDTTGQLPPIVERAGALFIDNSTRDLVVAGQPVRLTGVAVHSSAPKRDTIAALNAPTDAFTLLLSHRPGITYALPQTSDVDLVVAGHTHGGQVQLPIVSRYLWYSDVPAAAANGGLSMVNDFLLYVSTGVGMERHASPQVRFGVRPEVGIITVIPAD